MGKYFARSCGCYNIDFTFNSISLHRALIMKTTDEKQQQIIRINISVAENETSNSIIFTVVLMNGK